MSKTSNKRYRYELVHGDDADFIAYAVVAARVDGEWRIPDNRTPTLVRDTNLPRAVPVFVLDEVGAWRFVPKGRGPRKTPRWAS